MPQDETGGGVVATAQVLGRDVIHECRADGLEHRLADGEDAHAEAQHGNCRDTPGDARVDSRMIQKRNQKCRDDAHDARAAVALDAIEHPQLGEHDGRWC